MQYRLRSLLIVLALGPPLLAGSWRAYAQWQLSREWESVGGPGMIAPFSGTISCFLDTEEPQQPAIENPSVDSNEDTTLRPPK